MKSLVLWPLATVVLLLSACQRDAAERAAEPTGPVPMPQVFVVRDWPLPEAAIAAQPDLIASADGRLLLSWIEPTAGGHALRMAAFTSSVARAGAAAPVAVAGWSTATTIATGSDWFVNWADTPHLAATADGALWAHWLQKSAKATYAYDVALVRSIDGGASWSPPVLVNDDGKAVEHGFVSLWPAAHDAVGVAWLDGRHSGAGGHAGPGMPAGAMTLRAARFDGKLARSGETEVDATTCDCCQTDAALTDRGALLVYRDRTEAEVRDIAVTRADGDGWAAPHLVHADRWTMPACPVNGPAVAARGSEAVVAWYTAAGDLPTLRVARSDDAGDTFAPPLTVDQGPAVQGRVDAALDAHSAWVLWVREDAGGQSLQLARYATDLSRQLQRIEVGRIQGRGRATGFPQLALGPDGAHVAWTDVVDGKPRLRGAVVRAE